jgi:hypothetical protein
LLKRLRVFKALKRLDQFEAQGCRNPVGRLYGYGSLSSLNRRDRRALKAAAMRQRRLG